MSKYLTKTKNLSAPQSSGLKKSQKPKSKNLPEEPTTHKRNSSQYRTIDLYFYLSLLFRSRQLSKVNEESRAYSNIDSANIQTDEFAGYLQPKSKDFAT